MTQPRVLVTDSEVPRAGLDLLAAKCQVDVLPGPPASKEEIMEAARGVDAILWSSKLKLDAEIFEAAGPSLRVVSTMSAGYDNVDVELLRAAGIPVGHTPRVLDDAVADIAMALLLTASRRLQEGRRAMEQGEWKAGRPQWMLGRDVAGATVGVVGLGGIGQAFARRVRAFNIARLLYTGHRPKPEALDLGAEFVPLDELLAQSDFVLCACPLTEETRNLFDARAFGKMKDTATFINVSRGGCVDQDALLTALQTGQIWAAALDVMTPEPLPTDHPLLRQQNCVLFPHCGSATIDTRNAMACRAAENILCGLEGKPMPSQIP